MLYWKGAESINGGTGGWWQSQYPSGEVYNAEAYVISSSSGYSLNISAPVKAGPSQLVCSLATNTMKQVGTRQKCIRTTVAA